MSQTILISIIVFIVGFIIGQLSKKFKFKVERYKPNKTKVTKVKELLDYTDRTLTIVEVYSDGTSKTSKYAGNCTIWHELPSFRPCSTSENVMLHDKLGAYRYLKYRSSNTLNGYELLDK